MDLSKWMGRPTSLATEQISDVEEDVPVNNLAESSSEGEQQDDEAGDIVDRVNLPSFSRISSQLDSLANDGGSPGGESGGGVQFLGSHDEASYQELPRVFVEIRPVDVSSDEEYRFLPGHFTVDRILQRSRRRGEYVYKIQLRSGEHDQVSSSVHARCVHISVSSPRLGESKVIHLGLIFTPSPILFHTEGHHFSTTFRALSYPLSVPI